MVVIPRGIKTGMFILITFFFIIKEPRHLILGQLGHPDRDISIVHIVVVTIAIVHVHVPSVIRIVANRTPGYKCAT